MEINLSKINDYKSEIFFTIIIIIISLFLKGFLNFILDYRVIIIFIIITWYLGYLKTVQNNFYNNLNFLQKYIKK